MFTQNTHKIIFEFILNTYVSSWGFGEGLEPMDDVLTTWKAINTHVILVFSSSWGPSLLVLIFWVNFRSYGMFSSSDEVYDVSISWNYILLTATERKSEPKLKETRVNYFVLRHQPSGWLKSIHVRTLKR